MLELLAQSTTYDSSGAGAAAAVAAMMGTILLVALIATVIQVAVYYVILSRAGFNPWLSLLVLLAGLGHIVIWIILVFTEWPVQRELKALRASPGYGGETAYAGAAPGTAPGTTITPS